MANFNKTDMIPPDATNLVESRGVAPTKVDEVYLVEDDPGQALYLQQALGDAGYQVRVFSCPEQLLEVIHEGAVPSAIVLDMVFPEGCDAGASLLTRLREQQQDFPPVVFVSARDDFDARLKAYRAGASRYMLKPVNPDALADVLNVLTGSIPSEPYRVLMVGDDSLLLEAQSLILEAAGMSVEALIDPRATLDALDHFKPDLLMLDVQMPDVRGPELAAIIREREDYLTLPILFLSSETDLSHQLLELNLGGDDFLVKPVQPTHLVSVVRTKAERARQSAAIQRRLQTTLYEREREHLALDSHAIVSAADAQGNIISVNDRFCEISGYTRDELLGQNHRIVKSGWHSPDFYRDLWKTIGRGMVWQGEICNRRKDGSLYWVWSTITPFLNEDGRPYQYVSIRTDITALKEEEARQRSEARMKALVAEAAADLMAAPTDGVDAAIESVLGRVGEQMGVHRVYLFERLADGLHMNNSHEWCATGAEPQKAQLQHLPLSMTPWWWSQILNDQAVSVSDVENLPAEAVREREVFAALGVRALCGFPISYSGQTQGFLGVDQVDAPRDWQASDVHMLGLLASLISSALARRSSEQLAEAAQQRLSRGQLFANIGTWEWNIVTGELFWTDRIAPLFGYPEGDLETNYDNFLSAVHQDDRQAVIEAVNACVELDLPYEIEHRVVWPDGTVRWLLERGATVRDADGKALKMLGVVQDITERIESERRLRETEQRFAFAVEGAGDGVWEWNMVTGTLQLTGHYDLMLGYEGAELETTIDAWQSLVHPDDIAAIRQELQNYLEGRLDQYSVELRLLCKNGDYKWLLSRARVVERDINGKPLRLVGIHSDIDQRKRIEAELVSAREEADRANQAKSEFLSSMSHELRTPMNAILGFSQLLAYDETLSDDHQDNINEILKAGEHLLTLINEVLDLAKVESGKIELSLEPVALLEVAEECLSLVSSLAETRNITLRDDLGAGLTVKADRTRLKQVLLNLLSNAIKYNRKGGRVTLNASSQSSDRLRIEVTDTGQGIDLARQAELFQPFHRLDAETSGIEGTGIGLTITRRITELMGGSVGVDSEPGVGSTFWIELPCEAMAASGDGRYAGEADTEDALAKASETGQKTVLYIEDNPANLKLVSLIMGHVPGVHLLTAHTPSLGIELAMARQPDLILLDINLPGMDGYKVLDIFKADRRLQRTPVIAITANAMPRDIERGIAAGFHAYLTKPLNVEALLTTVQSCLGGGES